MTLASTCGDPSRCIAMVTRELPNQVARQSSNTDLVNNYTYRVRISAKNGKDWSTKNMKPPGGCKKYNSWSKTSKDGAKVSIEETRSNIRVLA